MQDLFKNQICLRKVVLYMGFLRWIVLIVVFVWALGVIFKIGGSMIYLLLIIAVLVIPMTVDSGKNKRAN